MAPTTLPERYDKFTAADGALDLSALLALSPEELALLDGFAHGDLVLQERCFLRGAVLMERRYSSFVAALAHVEELYSWTPRAFTEDHRPILLVLSEVTR